MRFFSITKKIGSVIILSLFVFSIFGTFASTVLAVTCVDGKAGDNSSKYCSLTTIPGAFDPKTAVDPVAVIKNIYGISIGIGAMLAVVMIIWAGIEYATTEAIQGKSDAKEKWQGAVFGLVLLLASYIILRTINVDLVNINLDLGTPKSGGAVEANAFEQIMSAQAQRISDLNTSLTVANQNITNKQDQLKVLQAQNPPNAAAINQLQNEIENLNNAAAITKIDALQTTADRQILTKLNSSNPGSLADARNAITTSLGQQQKVIDDLLANGNGADESTVQNLIIKLNENKAIGQSTLRQINVYQTINDTKGKGLWSDDLPKIIEAKIQWDDATAQTKKDLVGDPVALQNFNKELEIQRAAAAQSVKINICNNTSARNTVSGSQQVAAQFNQLCPTGGGGTW